MFIVQDSGEDQVVGYYDGQELCTSLWLMMCGHVRLRGKGVVTTLGDPPNQHIRHTKPISLDVMMSH